MIKRRLVLAADVGDAGSYHVGDEAMLEANLDVLRRLLPGVETVVVSPRPWAAAGDGTSAVPGLRLPTRREATDSEQEALVARWVAAEWRRATAGREPGCTAIAGAGRALADADALIVSGGGNLNAKWPEHVYERVALAGLARRLGKPVAFVGQTLGPELTSLQRQALGTALRDACWVGVRDLPSASLALALGVEPGRLDYQLDDALLLEPRPPDAAERSRLPRLEGTWIAVTLHPFAARGDESLRAVAAQLATVARTTGSRLLFVPHQAGDEGRTASDATFSQLVASLLPPEVERDVCPVLPARLVRWLTAEAAMVISTRFHPLVFGLAGGVPCLAIHDGEYLRVKALGALRHAGQTAWSLSLEQARDGGLERSALALWSRRNEVRGCVLARQPCWRVQEARRWRRLLGALGLADVPSTGSGGGDPPLLGHDPRWLALTFADVLEEQRSATRDESERLRRELDWVTGTLTWRWRDRLVRLRPLRALYRTLRCAGRGTPG